MVWRSLREGGKSRCGGGSRIGQGGELAGRTGMVLR